MDKVDNRMTHNTNALYAYTKDSPPLCFKCMFHAHEDNEPGDFNFDVYSFVYNNTEYTELNAEFRDLVKRLQLWTKLTTV